MGDKGKEMRQNDLCPRALKTLTLSLTPPANSHDPSSSLSWGLPEIEGQTELVRIMIYRMICVDLKIYSTTAESITQTMDDTRRSRGQE